MNDPRSGYGLLRDVLPEHMKGCRSIRYIRRSIPGGTPSGLLADDGIRSGGDTPGGLRLTMADGSEYNLMLDVAPLGGGRERRALPGNYPDLY